MDIETQKNKIESIAIWSITPNGKLLGLKIHNAVKESVFFVSEKLWQEKDNQHSFDKNIFVFKKLSKEIEQQFNNFSGHVFKMTKRGKVIVKNMWRKELYFTFTIEVCS